MAYTPDLDALLQAIKVDTLEGAVALAASVPRILAMRTFHPVYMDAARPANISALRIIR